MHNPARLKTRRGMVRAVMRTSFFTCPRNTDLLWYLQLTFSFAQQTVQQLVFLFVIKILERSREFTLIRSYNPGLDRELIEGTVFPAEDHIDNNVLIHRGDY